MYVDAGYACRAPDTNQPWGSITDQIGVGRGANLFSVGDGYNAAAQPRRHRNNWPGGIRSTAVTIVVSVKVETMAGLGEDELAGMSLLAAAAGAAAADGPCCWLYARKGMPGG